MKNETINKMKNSTILILIVVFTLGIYAFALQKNSENRTKISQQRKIERQREIREQIVQDSLRQDSINRITAYKDSIQIKKVITSSPNSAGGVDVNVIWKNNTKRTIKYISFRVVPYNRVGDEVGCDIRGYLYDNLKVTGPIKSGQTDGYGTYWGNVYYNHSIVKGKVSSYTITFMDNDEPITINLNS